MSDVNEYLFEYIKNMIYYPKKAELDLESLPKDYRKLGSAIMQMCEWSQEANEFAGRIANGELDTQETPTVNNGFAANIKALQNVLIHMTWQTKQIAKGDYNQKMLYMGGLSEAFNKMARQLEVRTKELNAERDLLRYFIETSNECVIVIRVDTNEKMYSNGVAVEIMDKLADKNKLYEMNDLCQVTDENRQSEWKFEVVDEDGENRIFRIFSVLTTWHGKKAIAHMAEDITGEEAEKSVLTNMALRDQLTNIYNRRYAMIRLSEMMKEDKAFSIAFVDIDYLKFCNDEFGHGVGDEYIVQVANALKNLAAHNIVVRSGGDEFILICEGVSAKELEEKLSRLRFQLMTEFIGDNRYIRKSFSYGTCERITGDSRDVSAYLELADRRMYEFKRDNKQKNQKYIDNRIIV